MTASTGFGAGAGLGADFRRDFDAVLFLRGFVMLLPFPAGHTQWSHRPKLWWLINTLSGLQQSVDRARVLAFELIQLLIRHLGDFVELLFDRLSASHPTRPAGAQRPLRLRRR